MTMNSPEFEGRDIRSAAKGSRCVAVIRFRSELMLANEADERAVPLCRPYSGWSRQGRQSVTHEQWERTSHLNGDAALQFPSCVSDMTQRKPTCDEPVSGGVPRRALGR